jgi:hypothetical protein
MEFKTWLPREIHIQFSLMTVSNAREVNFVQGQIVKIRTVQTFARKVLFMLTSSNTLTVRNSEFRLHVVSLM